MITVSTWTIGILLTIISLALGILSFAYGRSDAAKKAAREQTNDLIERMKQDQTVSTQLATMTQQLTTICGTTGGLDTRISIQEREAKERLERLAKVESSSNQAHHRLDDHGRRIESLEKQHMNGG